MVWPRLKTDFDQACGARSLVVSMKGKLLASSPVRNRDPILNADRVGLSASYRADTPLASFHLVEAGVERG